MPPAALSTLYTSEEDVEALLSAESTDGRLDDDADGNVSAAELTRLTTYACNYATGRINQFCNMRYSVLELAGSWVVNNYATVIACRWLCSRRGNPVPKSLLDLYQEVMEDLKAIYNGSMSFSDIAERNINTPAWSNVRPAIGYSLKKLRVERPISESTPTDYAQTVDRRADVIGPGEW